MTIPVIIVFHVLLQQLVIVLVDGQAVTAVKVNNIEVSALCQITVNKSLYVHQQFLFHLMILMALS